MRRDDVERESVPEEGVPRQAPPPAPAREGGVEAVDEEGAWPLEVDRAEQGPPPEPERQTPGRGPTDVERE